MGCKGKGRLYGFFESSLGYALLLVIVFIYTWVIITTIETVIIGEELPLRREMLSIGTIAGAMSIVIADSIRCVGDSIRDVSATISNMLVIEREDVDEIDSDDPETVTEKYVPSDKEKKEGEKHQSHTYDFMYL